MSGSSSFGLRSAKYIVAQIRCLPFEEISRVSFLSSCDQISIAAPLCRTICLTQLTAFNPNPSTIHVAAIGQVDLTVKDILTRATRHGLAARLAREASLITTFVALTPRSDSFRGGAMKV